MANNCTVNMVVKGTKEDVEEFDRIYNSTYMLFGEKYSYHKHFCGILERYDEWDEDKNDTDIMRMYIFDCKWSVSASLLNNSYSYYNRLNTDKTVTCLEIESENLDLYIELTSTEPGIGFQEHYIIDNGEILLDETSDFYSYPIYDEYKTKEDFAKDMDIELPDYFTDEYFEEIKKDSGFYEPYPVKEMTKTCLKDFMREEKGK